MESRHPLEQTVTEHADGDWLIRVTGPANYGALSPDVQGLSLLFVGVALSLLLFLLVLVLVGSRGRALNLVDEKTRELQHQALPDGLTGLPNRALIFDRLEQALARSRRQHSAPSAMFVDLDNFKDVNDTFGHAVGDDLLRELARQLSVSFATPTRSAASVAMNSWFWPKAPPWPPAPRYWPNACSTCFASRF